MSLTLTIPTWASIRDMFLLIIAYYSAWVHPQYDWWIFGITYYFGFLVALRSWWRLPRYEDANSQHPEADYSLWLLLMLAFCVLWVLVPLFAISKFFVTFGNKVK